MDSMAGVMIFVYLFGFLIAVLWIILPFAMFGIKPLLRQLIREQRTTNALLKGRLEGREQIERK